MLAQLRDLVIVIFGLLGIGAFLLFICLMILLYRKVNSILKEAKKAFSDLQGTSSFVSDSVVKPLIDLASLASGIGKAISFLMKFPWGKEKESG